MSSSGNPYFTVLMEKSYALLPSTQLLHILSFEKKSPEVKAIMLKILQQRGIIPKDGARPQSSSHYYRKAL